MARNGEKDILFEGAQGTLLDLDFGTYPYVSSGISSAAGAPIGGGIGPHAIDRVIGVFKAYSTRVGNGPFPSEFTTERDGDLGEKVRGIGKEYGVTTGRPRRCGYLDLVALKYACASNSIDSLALTKLDVYDGFDRIQACIAYRFSGKRLEEFPAILEELEGSSPITESFPGWEEKLGNARAYQELPSNAKDYIRFIEDFVGVPVSIVSIGSEREETIVRTDPWIRS
jgi:adenylosuccinate synthase